MECGKMENNIGTPQYPGRISSKPSLSNDLMTSHNSTLPTQSSSSASWLWIPYVLIATVFIVFLGVNFWCYHKRNRQRYLRKRDEKRVKDGLYERRKIIALMRAQFQVKLPSTNLASVGTTPTYVGDERTMVQKLPKVETNLGQNGTLRHQSIEDSFDYADEVENSISEVDLDDQVYDSSSLRNITFVSTVCSRDIVSSGIGQTFLMSKRGISGNNGSVKTVCK